MASTWPLIRRTRFNNFFFSPIVCAIGNLEKVLYKYTPAGIIWAVGRFAGSPYFERKEAIKCLTAVVASGGAKSRPVPSQQSLRL